MWSGNILQKQACVRYEKKMHILVHLGLLEDKPRKERLNLQFLG